MAGDFLTTAFIAKAREKHGKLYTYEKSHYIKSIVPTTITCKIHGDFEQTPYNHLKGSGCHECGKIKMGLSHRRNTEWFIATAKLRHGDTYDYNMAVYSGAKSRISIICRKHGKFTQLPNNHLYGSGCRTCNLAKHGRKPLTFADFISRARDIHPVGKFSYKDAVYVGFKKNITITCNEHGNFEKTPHKHLQGEGCPVCGINNCIKAKDGFVYFFAGCIDNKPCYKVGMARKPKTRIPEAAKFFRMENVSSIQIWKFESPGYAYLAEQHLHKLLRSGALAQVKPASEISGSVEIYVDELKSPHEVKSWLGAELLKCKGFITE